MTFVENIILQFLYYIAIKQATEEEHKKELKAQRTRIYLHTKDL